MAATIAQSRSTGAGRPGFSMIELLLVVTIGAILTSMGTSALGRYTAQQGARTARDAYIMLSVRARSSAIERGQLVKLEIDPAADRARVVNHSTGAEMETLEFTGDFDAEVTTQTGAMVGICYSPRGYAMASCSNVSSNVKVSFTRGAYTSGAKVRPLGQVEIWKN